MREVAHVLEMMQRTAPEKRITLWNDVGTSILPTHLSRPNILNTYHLYNDARCIAKRCSQKFDRHSERHSLPIACQNFTSCQMTREISASMLGLARHKSSLATQSKLSSLPADSTNFKSMCWPPVLTCTLTSINAGFNAPSLTGPTFPRIQYDACGVEPWRLLPTKLRLQRN